MMKEFTFRLIQEKDNKAVANVIRTVMTEFSAVGEGFSIMDKEVDEMWETYSQKETCFFVLILNKKIVGCGGVGPLKGGAKNTCELKKMYFHKEARGHGMGKELLEKCLVKAKEMGYKFCYLETLERMASANKLYEKMGFSPLEKAMGNTGHHACDRSFLKSL